MMELVMIGFVAKPTDPWRDSMQKPSDGAMGNQWILCSDRMPTEEEAVLVHWLNGKCRVAVWRKERKWSSPNGVWDEYGPGFVGYYDGKVLGEVTHWQPLPTPPGES